MQLSQAAHITRGQIIGNDVVFTSVTQDTRNLEVGALYVAILGENLDGHDYIKEAKNKGAVAALVSKKTEVDLPQLLVSDTIQALGEIARCHREQFKTPVVALTGSCGKTTTKTMLSNVLSEAGETLANVSSFNNNIGCPLTLLKLNSQHKFAILEIGANHLGEIAYLTQIAKPNVALITNAAEAHLQGFGSVDGVAREKGNIYGQLGANDISVINSDDTHASYWKGLNTTHRVITFGIKNPADVTAKNTQIEKDGCARFDLVIGEKTATIKLNIMGQHNVMNALAAAACAHALNVPMTAIAKGLEKAEAPNKRLVIHQRSHLEIIDDTYNANPLSTSAAINILASRPGYKIIVLGDMRELGENAAQYHREIGEKIKQAGINQFYATGELMQEAVKSYGQNAKHFENKMELIKALKREWPENTSILVKGSRSMKMEEIVQALI